MNRRSFLLKSSLVASGTLLGGRTFANDHQHGEFKLPELPYAHDALAPHIDAQTMKIHHGKHHAGYTRKLNAALGKTAPMKGKNIEEILSSLAQVTDASVQTALRNNGGGYYNHKLFWEVMAPPAKSGKMSQDLSKALDSAFGSADKMKEQFNAAASGRFGSGWAWLIVQDKKLKIVSTPNQDNPLMRGVLADKHLGTPILGVDVWEHAYYLKYQNRRGAYLDAWWNVVNWDEVSRRLNEAMG